MNWKLLLPALLLSLTGFAQKAVLPQQQYTRLVWADEFNKTGLPDEKNWNYEDGYLRNHELQFYTQRRPQNARMENGNLVITATNDSMRFDGKVFPITSASLVTQGLNE